MKKLKKVLPAKKEQLKKVKLVKEALLKVKGGHAGSKGANNRYAD